MNRSDEPQILIIFILEMRVLSFQDECNILRLNQSWVTTTKVRVFTLAWRDYNSTICDTMFFDLNAYYHQASYLCILFRPYSSDSSHEQNKLS